MSVNQTFNKQAILHVFQVLFLMNFFPCVAIHFRLPFYELFKSHLQLGHTLLLLCFG